MIRSERRKTVRRTCTDAHSVADQAAFHMAGVGACLIGGAARLRETDDCPGGSDIIQEALKDLGEIRAVLEEIGKGNTDEAIRMMSDLGYGRVLRRLV